MIVAATGEPQSLLPPLVNESVGRDVSDLIFERLATLPGGASPIDSSAYRPGLADRWQRIDSTTWRFHLRPEARWHDGGPVTAADVVFSFEAYQDSVIDASARSYLAGRVSVAAVGDTSVSLHFQNRSPEGLYDGVYHVRIIPAHIWKSIPKKDWVSDTASSHVVGSGPYKLVRWDHKQSLVLESARLPTPSVRRVVWRFSGDQGAALHLLLSHEADLVETVGGADGVSQAGRDSNLTLMRYSSAVYGFLGFRLGSIKGKPVSPPLRDREIRRALVSAIDRKALAHAVYGDDVRNPPGPISATLWIWSDSLHPLAYDTVMAVSAMDQAGWRRSPDGVRAKGGQKLALDILVPSTSPARVKLATGIQEMWRRVGVTATLSSVDFPVFQQRLASGQFDSYIGAWLDEPSPRSLADGWTKQGWGSINYGHYANPVFDTLLARASRTFDKSVARTLWHQALDSLNADAPAVFLYTPVNVAGVSHRLTNVTIDPYSWLARLPEWTLIEK